jgi:hypothetical protein
VRVEVPGFSQKKKITRSCLGNIVFVAGFQGTSDSAEKFCAFHREKAAGKILVYFFSYQSNILFALNVCEMHYNRL